MTSRRETEVIVFLARGNEAIGINKFSSSYNIEEEYNIAERNLMKEKHQIEKEKQLSLNQDTIRSKIFICPAKEDAQKVFLAGTFNNWALMPMTRLKSCFHAILRLKPGEYQYKFVVDGKWLEDPEAKSVQNVFGTANSIVSVD